ncbi:MAG: GNAT family N-acetyltransferase [Cellulosilyticaceae bacterium]
MTNDTLTIRVATPDDAAQLLAIYAYYVKETAITFEYEVPTLETFQERIQNTLKKYPYIVAESEGALLGYAYAGAFVGRAAYDWAVETTIYLNPRHKKMGLGKKLYDVLETIVKAQNILNMNACIAYPDLEDEHLTKNSVQFHEHLGYRFVGEFHKCGYKFGKWYNMVWMEKLIGVHPSTPSPIIPFPNLSATALPLPLQFTCVI